MLALHRSHKTVNIDKCQDYLLKDHGEQEWCPYIWIKQWLLFLMEFE